MRILDRMGIPTRSAQVAAGLASEEIKNVFTFASLSEKLSGPAQTACAIGGLIFAGVMQWSYGKGFKDILHLSEDNSVSNDQMTLLGRMVAGLGFANQEVKSVLTGAASSTGTILGLLSRNDHVVKALGRGDTLTGHHRAKWMSRIAVVVAMVGVFFETRFGNGLLFKATQAAFSGAAAAVQPSPVAPSGAPTPAAAVAG